jgi:type IV pilus assembly protein PilP
VFQTSRTTVIAAMIVCVTSVLGLPDAGYGEPGLVSSLRQVAPMRQDSLNIPSVNDVSKEIPASTLTTSAPDPVMNPSENVQAPFPATISGYDPSGRRDPFAPILNQLNPGQIDPTLPPLQRVGLTDMNLIAVVWGAYGYTAMVQTPDGNGYTVRRGTRMGPNNGVVSAISEKGIIVTERFTDVYGRKQEREYIKLLHPKEGLE